MKRTPARVLLILQSAAIGGMERQCVDLATELQRRGWRVIAVVPEEAKLDPVADSLRRNGTAVERITTDARSGRRLLVGGLLRLRRLVRGYRPDVVHLHVGGATGGLGAVLVSRLSSRSVVVMTEHDVPRATPSIAHRANRRLLDLSVHAVVAVSRHNALLRATRLGVLADKLAVVLNGVRLPTADSREQAANRAAVRAEFGIPFDATVFGTLARLVEGKGLDTLLKAFAEVLRSRDARLLVAGGGELEAELRSLAAALGIESRVVFAGHQPEPARFVDAMDVFVLAVPVGSGSIALLEAMARGRAPVITFGKGEEAVVSGETGLWAPPNDPAALAATMLRLGDDRQLRDRLGEAAATHVRRHYSIARLVDDLNDVYEAAREGRIPSGLRFTDAADRLPGARRAHAAAQ